MKKDTRPIHFVEDEKGLKDCVKRLKGVKLLGVDTESNSLFAFTERVCVIQVASDKDLFIIDPLTITDLSPLMAFLEDEKITKVFHGADYDVMCLKRDYDVQIRSIFDTYITSRLLGREKLGLADLAHGCSGVTLAKKYTKSNWGKRPLSPEQVEYLVDDVRYLHEIHACLSQELKDAGKEEEATKAFKKLESLPGMRAEPTVDDFWRMKRTRELSDPSLGALKALVALRLDRAKRLDRPVFKVIGNDTLVTIAKELPQTMEELSRIKGVSPYIQRTFGAQLLRAVQQGKKHPVQHPAAAKKRTGTGSKSRSRRRKSSAAKAKEAGKSETTS